MRVRIFWGSLFILLCLLSSVSSMWGATSPKQIEATIGAASKNLEKIHSQIQYHKKKRDEMVMQERGVIQQLEELNQKMNLTGQRIESIKAQHARVSARISELVQEIQETNGRINTVRSLLKDRLVAIYKYGGIAEFNLLLSASGTQDALSTSYLLAKIAGQDRALINELSERKARLDQIRAELSDQKALLERQDRQLSAEQENLRIQEGEHTRLLQRVRSEKSAQEEMLNELIQAEREIQQKIKQLLAEKARLAAQRRAASGGRVTPPQYSYRGGRLQWPLQGRISDPYGMRVHPVFHTRIMHTGIDIEGRTGDPVRAAAAGEVLYAGWLRGYGQVIILDHGNGLTTVYAHLSSMDVSEGADVAAGTVIGRVGMTGVATGPHLHFEVRINGNATNPLSYL